MKIGRMLVCLPLLHSVNAKAAEWVFINQDDETVLFADKAGIARQGKNLKAWFKMGWTDPQKLDLIPAKEYSSAKVLYYFDCGSRTYATIQSVFYETSDTSGKAIHSVSNDVSQAQFTDVIPETLGETMLNFVCSYAPKRQK